MQSNKNDISKIIKHDLSTFIININITIPRLNKRNAIKQIFKMRDLCKYDILKVESGRRSIISGINSDEYNGAVRIKLYRQPSMSQCEITPEKLYKKLCNNSWRIILREHDGKYKKRSLNI